MRVAWLFTIANGWRLIKGRIVGQCYQCRHKGAIRLPNPLNLPQWAVRQWEENAHDYRFLLALMQFVMTPANTAVMRS